MKKEEISFFDKFGFARRCIIIFTTFFLIFLNLVLVNGYIENGGSDDGFVKICLAYNAAYFVYISFYTYINKKSKKEEEDDDEDDEEVVDP